MSVMVLMCKQINEVHCYFVFASQQFKIILCFATTIKYTDS